MLFADDLVLVDKARDGVNAKLERQRETLESKRFKTSHTKTKYIECNFSGAKCQPIKKQYMHQMDVTEMRMLRWMSGKTRK